jgi:hypothetical protein
MKNMLSFILVFVLCGVGLSTYSSDGKNEKTLNKYREIIQDAAPDDWYTLASCAESCLKKNVLNKEVAQWIDRSLDIKRKPFNLEIKGDYYVKNRLPDEAGECYLEAIKIGIEEDSDFDISQLQSKIAKLVDLEM